MPEYAINVGLAEDGKHCIMTISHGAELVAAHEDQPSGGCFLGNMQWIANDLADAFNRGYWDASEQWAELVRAFKRNLEPNGEYRLARRDGEPMCMGEVMLLGEIMAKIDKLLEEVDAHDLSSMKETASHG